MLRACPVDNSDVINIFRITREYRARLVIIRQCKWKVIYR